MFGLLAKKDTFDIGESMENLDDLQEEEIDLDNESSETTDNF